LKAQIKKSLWSATSVGGLSELNYIKGRIAKFQKENPRFDDRNPQDVQKATELLEELSYDFPPQLIIRAVEEMKKEAEAEVAEARARFYSKLKEMEDGSAALPSY